MTDKQELSAFQAAAKTTQDQIAVNLKRVREERKLSRATVGKAAGTNGAMLSKVELEGRRLTVGEFAHFCGGYDVNPGLFLKGALAGDVSFDEVKLTKATAAQGLNSANLKRVFGTNTKAIGLIVAAKLKAAREELKLPMREVGERLGVAHTFVGKIEWCSRQLKIGEFVLYCAVLEQDPATLLVEIVKEANKQ